MSSECSNQHQDYSSSDITQSENPSQETVTNNSEFVEHNDENKSESENYQSKISEADEDESKMSEVANKNEVNSVKSSISSSYISHKPKQSVVYSGASSSKDDSFIVNTTIIKGQNMIASNQKYAQDRDESMLEETRIRFQIFKTPINDYHKHCKTILKDLQKQIKDKKYGLNKFYIEKLISHYLNRENFLNMHLLRHDKQFKTTINDYFEAKRLFKNLGYIYIYNIKQEDDELVKNMLTSQDSGCLEMLRLLSESYKDEFDKNYDFKAIKIDHYFKDLLKLIQTGCIFHLRLCGYILEDKHIRKLHKSNCIRFDFDQCHIFIEDTTLQAIQIDTSKMYAFGSSNLNVSSILSDENLNSKLIGSEQLINAKMKYFQNWRYRKIDTSGMLCNHESEYSELSTRFHSDLIEEISNSSQGGEKLSIEK